MREEAERRPLAPEEISRLRELLRRRERELEEESPESGVLGEIREALSRMARGEYGRCVDCGRWIRLRRLETIPWAKRCRSCQERWEMLEAV
ncbi:TraR/DksA C4-type zinc finger protein [Thermosulfurimonas sp. F29]|uniref:TraR/DksA family transcriptional regulator n=1 Tax=Thermosulfurimonas sp. F29 TaxID=2867247 RepID=UPI001C8294F6|nr:TraR/DksA C4-type zinc finger protein [Thermosulfurimonas sp. F29]MBX6422469.1 TraR/DksA C4-type zinc finger protein [Thermosulfurimonas sp. F29]